MRMFMGVGADSIEAKCTDFDSWPTICPFMNDGFLSLLGGCDMLTCPAVAAAGRCSHLASVDEMDYTAMDLPANTSVMTGFICPQSCNMVPAECVDRQIFANMANQYVKIHLNYLRCFQIISI